MTAYECTACKDAPDALCTQCSCQECGSKEEPASQIICDECNQIYHAFTCLPTPLKTLPPEDEDWYCPKCKNDDATLIQVRESEHLQKKKLDLLRLMRKAKGDWGRGMACVGRTHIAPVNNCFFGPIPGVEVGVWFHFRVQASEAGLHTPLVAGICGKENVGASSIVVACAYELDIDLGEEIYYTGSGGRDKDSKGRVGGRQTCDQQLKRCNKALAMSCHAPLNDEHGSNAGSAWQLGKPVRVLRSGNSRGATKRSPYLPKGGVRYDGIYKVTNR